MNYQDYGLNRFDEIAVRAVVAYLDTMDPEQRKDTLAKMDTDKDFFAEVVAKASELFKKDYDQYSRMSAYYKYIGKEYLEILKTVNSEAYLKSVPEAVYQYIRDCFK